TTRPQPGPSRPSASLLPDSADYQSHPGLIPDDPNRSGPGSTNLTAPPRIRPATQAARARVAQLSPPRPVSGRPHPDNPRPSKSHVSPAPAPAAPNRHP